MFPKTSKENEELKKEIKFNEAMDKQMKMGFNAAFKKGNVDSSGNLELIPTVIQSREPSPWLNPSYKNWMLFAFAGIAFVVLLVLILTSPGTGNNMYVRDEVLPMISAAGLHSSSHVLNGSDSDSQSLMLATPSTTTTIRTTEAPKVVDHILASIIVNNATVPQMDKTLIHQYSRADPYVILYVIEGQRHRKIGKTPVDKNTMSPRWNFLFEHDMKMSLDSLLNFEIWDSDNFNNDELIGKLYVNVNELIAQEVNGHMIRRNYGKGWLWFTVHWKPVYKN